VAKSRVAGRKKDGLRGTHRIANDFIVPGR